MAKQKRNFLDDVAARLRGLLDDLDRLLSPQSNPKPARVPIPVPARPERRPRKDDLYR